MAASVQPKASNKEAPNPQPQHIEKQVTKKDVEQAIQQATRELAGSNEAIGFSYEKKLGQLFVQVKDNVSGEVIREVPSKDFIKHRLAMQEMIGLLLDKQV
ncbi:MAG: hypothetical protein AUK35_00430 [Zetaproteobacteria bacterium CG2_30_46_52]|nr:MAG: hypothetical protein AUK35_00430 [Zetaproteobacteria bacterium CG2_30_46_52]